MTSCRPTNSVAARTHCELNTANCPRNTPAAASCLSLWTRVHYRLPELAAEPDRLTRHVQVRYHHIRGLPLPAHINKVRRTHDRHPIEHTRCRKHRRSRQHTHLVPTP